MHCHQRAVLNPDAEEKLLKAMGLELIRKSCRLLGRRRRIWI